MRVKLVFLLVALLIVSPYCSTYAQVLPTISQNEISVQPLPGYVLKGTAPSDLKVLIDIAVPLRNIDLLASKAKQISDPSSPSFRHFLTPAQIAREFLPTAEYESTLAFLQNAGISVVTKSLDTVIVAQATAEQIRQYLHSEVKIYTNGSDSYYMASGSTTVGESHFLASNVTALIIKPKLTEPISAPQNANITFSETGFSAKDLQPVYNATPLYEQGLQGENQTIGILDFFGSPTIEEDLELFNAQYGFPSATLNIIPIAPYNPNLGVSTGWSTETSLDVEMVHAMAPNATIDLYVTTGALSVSSDIAQIISLNRITALSMSLSFALEWQYQLFGGEWFFFNMLLPDQLFMLGSLQGITFLCASGDAGGSGYSSGPAGNSGFPSDSPYVTSVGGTQTYFYIETNGSVTSVQTGWSNYAFVPDIFNAGGGGGGVSFLEPKPWYQQNQQTPPSYPNGRMEPDLSLHGGGFPGVFIVDGGTTKIVGGTSASAPLMAGFIALIVQSAGAPLGLINPFLYSLGNDVSLYTKAYTPVTFGYNIPWTASFGYNMVSGWGAPNIGEIAELYNTQPSNASLSVEVQLRNSKGQTPFEVTPLQTIHVLANITDGTNQVTNGNFSAKLITLAGTALATPMTYESAQQTWVCTLTMGQQSGVAYVDVTGNSGDLAGEGNTEIFAGYLATFYAPTPTDPWTTASGVNVIVASTDLEGKLAPINSLNMQVNSYSILDNSFTIVDNVALSPANVPEIGEAATINLTAPYPAGPLTLIMQGSTYGFLPITNGIYLQTSVMYPEVAVQPGSLAPGQCLTIVTSPSAPLNVKNISSYESGETIGEDIATGCNVAALLIDSLGDVVSVSELVCQNTVIAGLLQVPENASSGLHTILLLASYDSLTLGYTLQGSFYGQVWVSNGTITPQIAIMPSILYMGQPAQISVDIRYPNGQEVTQGQYTAVVYPQEMQDQYTQIIYTQYINHELTTLEFNATQNRWVANITLPSPFDSSVVSSVKGNSLYYAGPYEVYVTGISFDGVPTTTALSAQKDFFIQPYVYLSGKTINSFQQNSGLALTEINITGPVELSNNVFSGLNYLETTTAKISDSVINGTLFVTGTNLTLRGVHGGNIVAINSTIKLVNSDLNSITLLDSILVQSSSSYETIVPSPPTIQILSPSNGGNYKGDVNVIIAVVGDNVDSVTVYLNDKPIKAFDNNGSLSFTLETANYPDGPYVLQVVATQTQGLSASKNSTIYLVNQIDSTRTNLDSMNATQSSLQNQINQLNSTQPILQGELGNLGREMNSSLDALQNQISDLQNSLNSAEYFAFAGVAIGVLAIIMATAIIIKRRSRTSS